MIDLAAAALESNPTLSTLPWADLGAGSGALAIAAAQLLQQHAKFTPPTLLSSGDQQQQQEEEEEGASLQAAAAHPRVYAVDLSPTAVAYATANAAACGVQGSVQAVQGSWFEPLQRLKGQLGGVLSNPPYIPRSDIESGLQAEVALHEPMTALDGGPGEGMDSLAVSLRYEGLGVQFCDVLLCAERTKRLQDVDWDPGINL
jgi:release factor glutamine methyltransferase